MGGTDGPHGTRNLLIDLDGTLVASRKAALPLAFIFHGCAGLGHDISLGKRLGVLRTVTRAVQGSGEICNFRRSVQSLAGYLRVEPAAAEALYRSTLRHMFPKLRPWFRPIPEAQRFLKAVRGRYRLILATNPVWPLEYVEMRMRWGGINPDWFEFIASSETMHHAKPETGYFLELLQHLNLRGSDCLFIGDSARKDFPAHAAGMRVFLLNRRPPHQVRGQAAWGDYQDLQRHLGGLA